MKRTPSSPVAPASWWRARNAVRKLASPAGLGSLDRGRTGYARDPVRRDRLSACGVSLARRQMAWLADARHAHGTGLNRFLPRSWDHLVARYGTTFGMSFAVVVEAHGYRFVQVE